MDATILDSAQLAYLVDEYREKLRGRWAAAMTAALKVEDARGERTAEQARREEGLGDCSTIPPIALFPQARGKALPLRGICTTPLSVTREECDAYEATITSALIVER